MSITLSEKDNGYKEGFAGFEKTAPGSNLAWLKSMRQEAITKFLELGFPTPQNEDWRFTNVAPIARSSFDILVNGHDKVSASHLTPYQFEGEDVCELVFINSRYSKELSTLSKLPEGVIVKNLTIESRAWSINVEHANDWTITNNTFIVRCDNGAQDSIAAATNIVSKSRTKYFSPEGSGLEKRYVRVKAKIKQVSAGTGAVHKLTIRSDDNANNATKSFAVGTGSAYHTEDVSIPYELDGRNIAFELEHDAPIGTTLVGYAFEYQPRSF